MSGLLGAFLECGLQIGEAGVAVGGEDDHFAVEDGGVGGEGGDVGGDGLHAMSPVEAGAGEELDVDPRLCGPGCGSRRA